MSTAQHSSAKDLTIRFAELFTAKDAEGIGALLTDDFALYDPALKWLRGRATVVDALKKQFRETQIVSYEVIGAYEAGNTGILEFKITLDNLVLYGVDFMQWENGRMTELRCYYNPPEPPANNELKPFSAEAKSLIKGTIYEHYKGNRYQILSVGRNSETLEESVVYQALDGDRDVWVRPLRLFLETVSVEGQSQPRFRRIS